MRDVLSEENRLRKMLEIEKALLEALHELGLVDEKCVNKAKEITLEDVGGVEKIQKIEKKIGHDIMALVKAFSDALGDCAQFVHFGATSNDIIDTAWALVVRDALKVIKRKLVKLIEKLLELAEKYEDIVMVGRTHGQHAVPITFGFKLMNHALEIALGLERLQECEKRVIVGKMAGAVGTMAAWRGKGLEIERAVMEKLGLKPVEISTQIVSRDRFAELICDLAIIASSIARFAEEVRNLQRPEILEVAEGFSEKRQVGSSTMPHKRNPIKAERICGLAKVMRGFVIPALENIILWHERDLTNSSSERIIITHSLAIMDQILEDALSLISGLVVYEENMKRNLKLTKGLNMAESIMIALTLKGMPRNEAHELIRRLSMKAYRENRPLKEVLIEEKRVLEFLSENEIEDLLNPEKYLGNYKELIERAKIRIKEIIGKSL